MLPPPATGPDVLPGGDGARAGGAADAGEALVVQRVVRIGKEDALKWEGNQ